MSKTQGTNPNAVDFTDETIRNKPFNTYKGGNSPDSAVLKGLIEPEVERKMFDTMNTGFEVFLTKRQIGGKKINGRKIKGWKEVPTVLDWDSTYRHTEWFKNFKKLSNLFKNNSLGEIFKTGELNKRERKFNHALCVFLNSFFQQERRYHTAGTGPDTDELLSALEYEELVQSHAEKIYLNNDYEKHKKDKTQDVKINGEDTKIKYNQFKITTYEQIVELWFDYLDMMEEMKVFLVNMSGEESVSIDVQHRWNQEYTDKMYAKFNDLGESKFTNMWTTMLSLTTYQDKVEGEPEKPEDWDKERGASWFEAMERLKDSLTKILDTLRQIARREIESDFHYIWVVEAHETGYPHLHVAIFGDVSEWLDSYKNELRVKELLEEKYDLGKSGIATSFDTKPPSGDGTISELASYLMKYIQKNLGEYKDDYEEMDLSDKDWGTLVYNACMFTSGYRTWGTSKEVGGVMKTETVVSEKSHENLGGELTADSDKEFGNLVKSKGDDLLKSRLRRREKFRKAVADRKNA